jgi:MFS family permease
MKSNARFRLSVMMFLQYAIWGAWAPILFLHLANPLKFTTTESTWVYMTMALASMVAPVAGQLADRNFSTERYLAFSHLVAGVLIFWLYYIQSFWGVFTILLFHCLLYAPTVALTNSIALQNLPNGEKDFGKVRLWGTIGWIVISWVFSVWLGLADGLIEIINPAWKTALVEFRERLPVEYKPGVGQCLLVAGVLSWVLAAFCLLLPHTPPAKEAKNPFAFLGSFKLMRNPSFAVLIVVAFLVSTELQFYYVLTPGFFNEGGGPFNEQQVSEALLKQGEVKAAAGQEADATEEAAALKQAQAMIAQADAEGAGGNGDGKVSREELEKLNTPSARAVLAFYDEQRQKKGGLALPQAWVGPVMTLGQVAEVLILLLVPFSLKRYGFRWTIAIGILAWSVRYFIFSLGGPRELVIASQTLHGFGFGFFFVGAFLYADTVATPDIRASVQSFIIFVTYGAGMVVSSLIAGPIAEFFGHNWHYIFLVPAGITLVCTIVFILGFRDPPRKDATPAPTPTT